MGVIIASILTLCINKKDNNKILACILMGYIMIMNTMLFLRVAIFKDYLEIYTVLTLILLLSLIVHSGKKFSRVVLLFSIIIPHLYYLLVLHKPYLLDIRIPIWWLFNVDSILNYSVFFILYEQANDFKFKEMQFKEYMLNILIVLSLILF